MSDSDTSIELSDTRALEGEAAADTATAGGHSPDLDVGDVVDDRYEILAPIGKGGMGRVFKAEDLTLHEMVALKVLRIEAADDPESVEQFRREVKLARRVAHPNVVRTFDIGSADGVPFLTMEYVAGPDLRDVMANDDFGIDDAVAAALAIADGLDEAHQMGVLHRDLKPENVLIYDSGRAAVTDFGIAGALRDEDRDETVESLGIGTPAYMAPEQVRGDESMDQRVDIYALGLVLFEMISGRLPWQGQDAMAQAVARLEEPAPSLGDVSSQASGPLVQLVDQSLERDPDDRPDDIRRLERILEAIAEPTPAGPRVAPKGPEDGAELEPAQTRNAAPTRGQRADTDRTRVIVLPFDRDGSEAAGDAAAGMREDLIYRLGRWDHLDIRLREPTGALPPELGSSVEIGRQLNADAVVRGAVESVGGRLRARAALDTTGSGDQVWSDLRDFEPEAAYEVADEWARAMSDELNEDEPDTDSRHEQLSAPARDLLNEARHLMRERWRLDVEPAIERLEQSRARAPEHPRVLSQLAIGYGRLAFQEPDHRDAHVDRAVSLAREAIDRSDDRWAEPRYALAMAHFNGRSYGRAIATLRAALERLPDYAEAHELLGRIHSEIGPIDRATHHLERTLELNPYLFRVLPDFLRVHALAGRWEAVDEIAERTLESDSHRIPRAQVASRLRLWHDRPSLERIVEAERSRLEETDASIVLDALEAGGLTRKIRETIDRRLDEEPPSRRKIVLAQASAEVAAYSGEDELTVAYLDRAIETGLTDILWLEHCPLFDPFRDRPPFVERFARVRGRVDDLDA